MDQPLQPPAGAVFVEDVHNLVLDYCADSVEAFVGCMGPALQGALTASGANIVDDGLLAEGAQGLYNGLVAKAFSSLHLFEELCRNIVPQKPAQACLPKIAYPGLPADSDLCSLAAGGADSEEQLLARVASLRHELAKVDVQCIRLNLELQRTDKAIAACGDASELQAAAATATFGKASIAAITEAAGGLQAMMEKAMRMRFGSGGKVASGTEQETDAAGITQAAVKRTPDVGVLGDLI